MGPVRYLGTGLLSALVWVVVVSGGSTFAWVAIDHAGRDVVIANSGLVIDDSALNQTPQPILPTDLLPGIDASNGTPSVPTVTSASPKASTPTSRPTASPARSTPTPTTTPSRTATPTPPAPPPTGHRADPTPATVTASVRAGFGSIIAACQGGTRLEIRSAIPAGGWGATVLRHDQLVAVAFVQSSQTVAGFVVFVGCRNGQPTFVSSGYFTKIDFGSLHEIIEDYTFTQIGDALHWQSPAG